MTLAETPSFELKDSTKLDSFRNAVGDWQDNCTDAWSEFREVAYGEQDQLRYVGTSAATTDLFGEGASVEVEGHMTMHALSQLTERLQGPPMRWLANEMKVKAPLRARVMNAVLADRPNAKLFMRHYGGLVRAILSDQYSAFNHEALLDLVAGAIESMGEVGQNVDVHNAQIGDQLRAYVLLPSVTFDRDPEGDGPDDGGGLHPAAYISNSEVGSGKVRVHGGLFREVCSNGMILGWEKKEGLELIHRNLSEATVASAVADALVNAFRLSEDAAKQFIESQQVHLRNDRLEKLASEWGSKYGLTLPSIEAWGTLATMDKEPTLFGFLNYATALAQDREPAEREAMERMAGDLLYAELPVSVLAGAPLRATVPQ